MKIRSAILSASAAVTLAGPQAVFGQATTDEAATSVEEIIVTARRREEALQDVPISVSALSGDALERAGVTDIQASAISNAFACDHCDVLSQRNVAAFALRGQRTQETQLFTDPPVGTYFAEVVQPRPYGFGNSLYDLESVQVLKGVQGTLFGRNMTGGAVLVEPRHPVARGVFGRSARLVRQSRPARVLRRSESAARRADSRCASRARPTNATAGLVR